MKYAVIYQSKSGNTKRIAEEIYSSLSVEEKEIYDIDWNRDLPQADVYFVGFGIRNGNCSIDVISCFEQITGGRLALFVTCGLLPTEKYKARLERQLDVWMPEKTDYLGMFLCQGKMEENQQEIMINDMPEKAGQLTELFEMGNTHPNYEDYQNAAGFARDIQWKVKHSGNIPIR